MYSLHRASTTTAVMDEIQHTLQILANIQHSIECRICLDVLDEPSRASCGHSFCTLCVGHLLRHGSAPCPLCKKRVTRRALNQDRLLATIVTQVHDLFAAVKLDSQMNISPSKYRARPSSIEYAQLTEINDQDTSRLAHASTTADSCDLDENMLSISQRVEEQRERVAAPVPLPLPDQPSRVSGSVRVQRWMPAARQQGFGITAAESPSMQRLDDMIAKQLHSHTMPDSVNKDIPVVRVSQCSGQPVKHARDTAAVVRVDGNEDKENSVMADNQDETNNSVLGAGGRGGAVKQNRGTDGDTHEEDPYLFISSQKTPPKKKRSRKPAARASSKQTSCSWRRGGRAARGSRRGTTRQAAKKTTGLHESCVFVECSEDETVVQQKDPPSLSLLPAASQPSTSTTRANVTEQKTKPSSESADKLTSDHLTGSQEVRAISRLFDCVLDVGSDCQTADTPVVPARDTSGMTRAQSLRQMASDVKTATAAPQSRSGASTDSARAVRFSERVECRHIEEEEEEDPDESGSCSQLASNQPQHQTESSVGPSSALSCRVASVGPSSQDLGSTTPLLPENADNEQNCDAPASDIAPASEITLHPAATDPVTTQNSNIRSPLSLSGVGDELIDGFQSQERAVTAHKMAQCKLILASQLDDESATSSELSQSQHSAVAGNSLEQTTRHILLPDDKETSCCESQPRDEHVFKITCENPCSTHLEHQTRGQSLTDTNQRLTQENSEPTAGDSGAILWTLEQVLSVMQQGFQSQNRQLSALTSAVNTQTNRLVEVLRSGSGVSGCRVPSSSNHVTSARAVVSTDSSGDVVPESGAVCPSPLRYPALSPCPASLKRRSDDSADYCCSSSEESQHPSPSTTRTCTISEPSLQHQSLSRRNKRRRISGISRAAETSEADHAVNNTPPLSSSVDAISTAVASECRTEQEAMEMTEMEAVEMTEVDLVPRPARVISQSHRSPVTSLVTAVPSPSAGEDRSVSDLTDKARSLCDLTDEARSLCDLNNRDRSVGDLNDKDRSVGDLTDKDRSLCDLKNRDRSVGDLNNRDRSLCDLTDDARSLCDLTDKDRSVGDLNDKDRSVGDLTDKDRSLCDLTDEDRSLCDLTDKDRSLCDLKNRDRSLCDLKNGTSTSCMSLCAAQVGNTPPVRSTAGHIEPHSGERSRADTVSSFSPLRVGSAQRRRVRRRVAQWMSESDEEEKQENGDRDDKLSLKDNQQTSDVQTCDISANVDDGRRVSVIDSDCENMPGCDTNLDLSTATIFSQASSQQQQEEEEYVVSDEADIGDVVLVNTAPNTTCGMLSSTVNAPVTSPTQQQQQHNQPHNVDQCLDSPPRSGTTERVSSLPYSPRAATHYDDTDDDDEVILSSGQTPTKPAPTTAAAVVNKRTVCTQDMHVPDDFFSQTEPMPDAPTLHQSTCAVPEPIDDRHNNSSSDDTVISDGAKYVPDTAPSQEMFCTSSGTRYIHSNTTAINKLPAHPAGTYLGISAATCATTPVTASITTPVTASITTRVASIPASITTPVTASITTPVTASITTPVTASITTPVTASITTPVTASITTPVTASITTPVTASITTPITASITTPVTASITTPITASITTPVTASITTPVTASITTPVTASITTPLTAPVTTPVTAPATGPVVVVSGLRRAEQNNVQRMLASCGGRLCSTWSGQVSHVVVKTERGEDGRLGAARTLKYLQGVAAGVWVISYCWILDCLQAGRKLDESKYEVCDSVTGESGARRSRQLHAPLFSGLTFCCLEPFCDITCQQLQELIVVCGGQIVDSLASLSTSAAQARLIVAQDEEHDGAKLRQLRRTHRVACVSYEWLLDCVAAWRQYSLLDSVLCGASAQDLTQMALPSVWLRLANTDTQDTELFDTMGL